MPPLKDIPLTHIEGIEFHFVETLHEVIEYFSGQLTTFSLPATISSELTDDLSPNYEKDFQIRSETKVYSCKHGFFEDTE